MVTELGVLNKKVTETSWHQPRCQSWDFGHVQNSFHQDGLCPLGDWESRTSKHSVKCRLNLETIEGLFFFFFINSQLFSSTECKAVLTQSLGAAQRLTGSLLICHPTLAWKPTDPTSPLAETRTRWQLLPLGLWREPNLKKKAGRGREERLSLAHVYLENRSVFSSLY
jgi:hypothetical protein